MIATAVDCRDGTASMAVARGSPDPPRSRHDELPRLLDHWRALHAALAVARQGSTIRAAQCIHLSQPAVTRAIAMLESACEQPLFLRTTRGTVPTPQGERLVARADACMELVQRGARDALGALARKATRSNAPERFAQHLTPSRLRTLLAVSEGGSESRAAEQLGVSQPAVHAASRALEQQLDVPIFYKSAAGTRLTPPGDALLLRVKQALAELRALETELSAWTGRTRGRIVVGMLPLSVTIFLPRAIAAFMPKYPDMDVQVIDGTYETLVRLLRSAEIDVLAGALRRSVPHADIAAHSLFVDDLIVIANRRHPCWKKPRLELADLLRWPWVAPLPGTPADRLLHALFAQHDLPAPSRRLCANSPTMTLACVLQSDRLAIASRGQVLQDDLGGQIRIVPVRFAPVARRIGLLTRILTDPSPPLAAFLDICRRSTQELPGAEGVPPAG